MQHSWGDYNGNKFNIQNFNPMKSKDKKKKKEPSVQIKQRNCKCPIANFLQKRQLTNPYIQSIAGEQTRKNNSQTSKLTRKSRAGENTVREREREGGRHDLQKPGQKSSVQNEFHGRRRRRRRNEERKVGRICEDRGKIWEELGFGRRGRKQLEDWTWRERRKDWRR